MNRLKREFEDPPVSSADAASTSAAEKRKHREAWPTPPPTPRPTLSAAVRKQLAALTPADRKRIAQEEWKRAHASFGEIKLSHSEYVHKPTKQEQEKKRKQVLAALSPADRARFEAQERYQ